MITLHGYWRSSASYRVRIALALKEVEVAHKTVNLREGHQQTDSHRTKNPQGFVPVLELEDGTMLTQSLAILDYLDARFPEPSLMPSDPVLRARMLAASLVIAADTSPIQNLSVLNYIRVNHEQEDAGVKAWAAHWITNGFTSLETTAQDYDTPFLMTDRPMLFECCLIPQIYNARRFGVDMSAFPKLSAIEKECQVLPSFQNTLPENQADAP